MGDVGASGCGRLLAAKPKEGSSSFQWRRNPGLAEAGVAGQNNQDCETL
ncbi:hypothetical protein BH23CHL5_BH23CHL5_13720 [soil metagenome]